MAASVEFHFNSKNGFHSAFLARDVFSLDG